MTSTHSSHAACQQPPGPLAPPASATSSHVRGTAHRPCTPHQHHSFSSDRCSSTTARSNGPARKSLPNPHASALKPGANQLATLRRQKDDQSRDTADSRPGTRHAARCASLKAASLGWTDSFTLARPSPRGSCPRPPQHSVALHALPLRAGSTTSSSPDSPSMPPHRGPTPFPGQSPLLPAPLTGLAPPCRAAPEVLSAGRKRFLPRP